MSAGTRRQVTRAVGGTARRGAAAPGGELPGRPTGGTDAGGPNLGWSRPGEALRLLVTGRTVRSAAPVAVVVGSVLSAVNQGAAVLDGSLNWVSGVRMAVNYVVPFGVASYGYLNAWRMRNG